jgi:hypothetical protein
MFNFLTGRVSPRSEPPPFRAGRLHKNIDSNDKRFRKASCGELKRAPYIVSEIRGFGAFSLFATKESCPYGSETNL